MIRLIELHERIIKIISDRIPESLALLVLRVALAGIFWRSGRSKVEPDSWFQISGTTYYLFQNDYSGVPLPADIAAVMATGAEHLLPILLILGLAARWSALALLGMTIVIQLFVFPDAWWSVHLVWVAICLIIVSRGSGLFALDPLVGRLTRATILPRHL